MDVAILATLVSAFGLLVTTHLGLSVLLLFRSPWWHGLLALIVPPLAPYWGYTAGLKGWAAVWLVAIFLYAFALIAALAV